MNELINENRRIFRGRLFTTACAAALLALTSSPKQAKADDGSGPTVWIDLGGQLERVDRGRDALAPPFLSKFDFLNFDPVLPVQRPSRYEYGLEGALSFAPKNSDWVFSIAIRYSRSNGNKTLSQQADPTVIKVKGTFGSDVFLGSTIFPQLNADAAHTSADTILDFGAGKDVGFGLFSKGESILGLGVRFAQFTSKEKIGFNGIPSFYVTGTNVKYGIRQNYHRYAASLIADRSFEGAGPSVSWKGDASVFGSKDGGNFTFDWGFNAAVLFGRQKAHGEQNITGSHYEQYTKIASLLDVVHTKGIASSYHHPDNIDRARTAIVPNVGGFAGLSFRYPNAKVSLGYRADFFFGAMDGGTAARETKTLGFYGPFATISIGLGG